MHLPRRLDPGAPLRNLAVADDAMNQDASFPSCRAQSVSHTTTSAISQMQIFNTAIAQSATFWSASQLTGPTTRGGRNSSPGTRSTRESDTQRRLTASTIQRLLHPGRAGEKRRSLQSPFDYISTRSSTVPRHDGVDSLMLEHEVGDSGRSSRSALGDRGTLRDARVQHRHVYCSRSGLVVGSCF